LAFAPLWVGSMLGVEQFLVVVHSVLPSNKVAPSSS